MAVISVADVEAGELPKAFVVAQPGSDLAEDDVKAHDAEHLASYQHIRLVEVTEEIPKSPSGKSSDASSETGIDHTERHGNHLTRLQHLQIQVAIKDL